MCRRGGKCAAGSGRVNQLAKTCFRGRLWCPANRRRRACCKETEIVLLRGCSPSPSSGCGAAAISRPNGRQAWREWSCVAPLVPLLNFLDSIVRTWRRARIRSGCEARDGDEFGHESPLVVRTCSPAKLLGSLKFVGIPGCDDAWRCHAYGWHTQGALQGRS